MTGKDIIVTLSQNGTQLASTCIRSHDIQTDAETIEVASATQSTWREYIADRKGWSLTVNYLVLAAAKVADLLKVGQTFTVTVSAASTGTGDTATSLSGTAILTAVKQTATVGNLAQGSFSFQGSGALS